MQEYAKEHNLVLYYLPPNTTHFLQPEDVAVFRPLKEYYHQSILNTRRKVSLLEIPELVSDAVHHACTKETIEAGFRATGLVPFFREKGLSMTRPMAQPSRIKPPTESASRVWREQNGPLDVGQVETCEMEVQTTEASGLAAPKKSWTRRNLGINDVVNGEKLRAAKSTLGIDESADENSDGEENSKKRRKQRTRATEDAPSARRRRTKHGHTNGAKYEIPSRGDAVVSRGGRGPESRRESTLVPPDPVSAKRRRVRKVPYDPSDLSVDAGASAHTAKEASGGLKVDGGRRLADRPQKRHRQSTDAAKDATPAKRRRVMTVIFDNSD